MVKFVVKVVRFCEGLVGLVKVRCVKVFEGKVGLIR